jgi:acyl-CoA dehydrogenase
MPDEWRRLRGRSNASTAQAPFRMRAKGCGVDFTYSAEHQAWIERVRVFIDQQIRPNEQTYHHQLAGEAQNRWQEPPLMKELIERARSMGLWNLFMPAAALDHRANDFDFEAPGLTNLVYASLAEEMGRFDFASRVFNCSAPDTGNMELLLRYGSAEQQEYWLAPLMEGRIRSAFLMTEPAVASSDATNIETRIERDGDHYVINGRKWWSSGVGDRACAFYIVMGISNSEADAHSRHSQIIVPEGTPGITVLRMLDVFGYDDAPHGHAEVLLENVRVPADNLILGEGRGFEIAQGRLGPGRIHHCMRTIGAAEEAFDRMCARLVSRKVFGKRISEHSVWEERIARGRADIEMARLLTLQAADKMDRLGNVAARKEISLIKIAVPRIALRVIDDAIQAFGGGGVCEDFGLASRYAKPERCVSLTVPTRYTTAP